MLAVARDGFGTGGRTQFVHDVPQVRFHRSLGDEQPAGDLGVGLAAGEQVQHLEFAAGQVVGDAQVVKLTGTSGQFKSKTVGSIKLKKGTNKVKLVLKSVKKDKAMDLRGLTFKPVK